MHAAAGPRPTGDLVNRLQGIIETTDQDVPPKQVASLLERCVELEQEVKELKKAAAGGDCSLRDEDNRILALQEENHMLQDEIANMRRQLAEAKSQHSATISRKGENLEAEVANLQDELSALRQQNRSLTGRIRDLEEESQELQDAAHTSGYSQLRKQVKEFTLNTQTELEKKLVSATNRAVSAEEQLDELQRYMTQSTLAYQKEIVRLREIVGQYAPHELQRTLASAPDMGSSKP